MRMSVNEPNKREREPDASDNSVQRYETVDEKVDLVIERMSECLRLVLEFMESKKVDGEYHIGYKSLFSMMMKYFPPCIEELSRIQSELKTARLRTWLLRSRRATALGKACDEIYDFHQNYWHNTDEGELRHIRNEMQNLIRLQQNLHPEKTVGGFTTLHTRQGPMIKWYREETGDFVVVAEYAWKTECAVCFDREREVVLFPCSHWVLCRACAYSCNKCPICRARVVSQEFVGNVKRDNEKKIIQAAQFSECEGHTRGLLKQLEAMGEIL